MYWMGVHSPPLEGQCWLKRALIVHYRDCLPSAVQKQVKRSTCRLGYGIVKTQGSMHWTPNAVNSTEGVRDGGREGG